ncbi:lysine--tRNA ligase [Candidatus Wolfebacteria bacterium]|nr:lysine--tRNA ligase [Candidatus Wolfebacteria bacterium]
MSSLEELREERLKKLNLLKEKGIDPYPARSGRDTAIVNLLANFDEGKEVTIAGRVMALRRHGGSTFIDLYDGTGKIQGYLKEDALGAETFSLFDTTVDVGDFIDLTGTPGETKRGEKSIIATGWRILAKSLRPLPEKWHGLQDTEERLRKRYLDILFNSDVHEMVEKRAVFWQAVREFMLGKGFLEVETPTLELTTGGAEATPFKTHHNDFDLDVYLRISIGELWQKRLMVAGFPRTFEIGRVYRNEGSSPEHLQEFTNMEFYAAYMDLDEGKRLTQELYREIASKVFGKTKFTTRGHTFDLADKWEDLDYVATVEKIAGVNVLDASEAELMGGLRELGVEYEGESRERLTDALWKHCRRQISGPAFLVNHPKLVAPLSKGNPQDERLTVMFQVILAGSELSRAHAELNDPLDQRKRFEEQQKLIEGGDTEAMMPDWDYVEAMEYGMPPSFGLGVGDRLFAFLADKPIRETQIFPLLKPKND